MKITNRFDSTGTTADRPRSGRPRMTTPRQDCTSTAGNIPGLHRNSSKTVRGLLAGLI